MSDTTDNAGWTGAPPGMLQDDSAGMSKWLASKPDAMRNAREAAAAIPARAPECVIVCQQSVDCGAWPNGACEQGCAQLGDEREREIRTAFEHYAAMLAAAPPPAAQAGDELPPTVLKAARALLDALDFSCGPHPVWAAERDALRAALAARGAQAGDEREAFEAWLGRESFAERSDSGKYVSAHVDAMWSAWQAARRLG